MKTTTCFEVLYQWILENIEDKPKILSSKMILFRGEGVFRVALKNTVEEQTLTFVAINLNKMGMKVHEVSYSNQNFGNKIVPLVKQNDGHDTTLQVFSVDLNIYNSRVSGPTTFNFHIRIEGSVTEFSYQLADRLLKNQLWMAVKKLQWTDIDFIVKGKKISAHKCVLAARSEVFATEFAKNGKMNRIVIDDVDLSSFEQFLHFLYTGETNKSLASEQLLKLAKRYCLTTLCRLCEIALGQFIVKEMACSLVRLIPENYPMLSVEIWPAKDTELYFDPYDSTCLVSWKFDVEENQQYEMAQELFEYQKEKRFSTHFTGNFTHDKYGYTVTKPTFRLFYVDNGNSNYRVVEAVCSVKDGGGNLAFFQWTKMERRSGQENGLVVKFLAPFRHSLIRFSSLPLTYTVTFRIKIASNIENYHHEMMDSIYATQLWNAATNRQMTDVEISVGSRKFEAHRVVLAARSPVFDAQLEKDKTIAKSSITVDETIDSTTFQHFLEFLYTGTLKISANNKKLLALAEMYKVETLKKLCQTATRGIDVDKLSSSFIAVL